MPKISASESIIHQQIHVIRGRKVMLDAALAKLYCVPTHRLNEAVKRNARRFPSDFVFQLTAAEKEEVIANCDNLKTLKFSAHLPFAFTEQGVAMLSSVLKSERAIDVNVQIMRAFVKLRELMQTHKDLLKKIQEMENKYDQQFKTIFDAIRQLISHEEKPRRTIGFGS